METLKKTMDNEGKMKMIVILCSKIYNAIECLLFLHRLTIIDTCIYRNQENTFRP